ITRRKGRLSGREEMPAFLKRRLFILTILLCIGSFIFIKELFAPTPDKIIDQMIVEIKAGETYHLSIDSDETILLEKLVKSENDYKLMKKDSDYNKAVYYLIFPQQGIVFEFIFIKEYWEWELMNICLKTDESAVNKVPFLKTKI